MLSTIYIKTLRLALVVALAGFSIYANADRTPKYPNDPYYASRQYFEPEEIGTVVGQIQMSAGAGAAVSSDDDTPYAVGQFTLDYIVKEFLGIRFTAIQELQAQQPVPGVEYRFSSARVGPSIHLVPYRRVDLGGYAEGGLVVVDMFDGKTSERGAEFAVGGFMTLHLTSYFFAKAEMHRSFASFELEGVTKSHNRTVATGTLGFAF